MFKEQRILSDIAKAADEAASSTLSEMLEEYRKISNREEETTHNLAREIRRLIKGIKERLHGRTIRGVKFGAYVLHKQTEEPVVGADLAGIIRLTVDNITVSKMFLAQAKVGEFRYGHKYPTTIRKDPNLLPQCEKMLKRSSDSFVFIYTERGVFVVPALSVRLANKNSLDLREHYCYERFGNFYKEFFRCFIGDHLIYPPDFDPNKDLPRLASETGAANLLVVTATTDSDR